MPQRELIPVPSGLDAAGAVSLVLYYITAYEMLHRSAKVKPGQRVLIRKRVYIMLGCRRRQREALTWRPEPVIRTVAAGSIGLRSGLVWTGRQ